MKNVQSMPLGRMMAVQTHPGLVVTTTTPSTIQSMARLARMTMKNVESMLVMAVEVMVPGQLLTTAALANVPHQQQVAK